MRRMRGVLAALTLAAVGTLGVSGAPALAAAATAARSPHIVVGPFQPVVTPSLGNQTNEFSGASCASASFCVVVGTIGWGGDPTSVPIIEQWNGTVWTIATAPVPSSLTGASLESVSCPSTTFCVAVGNGFNGPHGADTTFIEQWNGVFWLVATTPNYGVSGDNDLASVSCTGPSFCAAVGSNFGRGPGSTDTGFIEQWDGSAWSLVLPPTPPGAMNTHLNGVDCTSTSSCTAVGDWDDGTLVETWGGSGWSVVPSPNAVGWSNTLSSVSCIGSYFCTAVGSNGSPSGTVPLIESWNGTAWSVSPVFNPNPNGGYLQAVTCLGVAYCMATGAFFLDSSQSMRQNLAFTFDGTTWSASPTASPSGTPSTTNGELDGVTCVTGWSCLTVGYQSPESANTSGFAAAASLSPSGYRFVAADGGIFSYGAPFFGSMGGQPLNKPIVGMAAAPDGMGYWLVASDGGIFAFGDARFFGSMGGQPLNKPIVGITATAGGAGYYEVASDGGLFAFGDATFFGSMGGKPLNAPIVGIATTPDGNGYYEVASDGGLFAFGDATFFGSMGGKPLNAPIVGIGMTPAGGYYEVASDGGLFAFGAAPFFGSMGGQPLNRPIVGIAPLAAGYYEVASDGGIFAFGSAPFFGSQGGKPLNAPIVAMTT